MFINLLSKTWISASYQSQSYPQGKWRGKRSKNQFLIFSPTFNSNVSDCFEDGIVNETLELSDKGSLHTADDTKQKGGKVYVMGNRALYTSEPGAYLHTYVPMATGWRVVTTELWSEQWTVKQLRWNTELSSRFLLFLVSNLKNNICTCFQVNRATPQSQCCSPTLHLWSATWYRNAIWREPDECI